MKASALLAAGGFVTCLIENVVLKKIYGGELTQSFGLGTILLGTGMFSLGLAVPNLGGKTFLPKLGQFTMGIYVSHILAWEATWNLIQFFPIELWQIIFPFIIYGVSLGVTVILKKIPVFRKAVS